MREKIIVVFIALLPLLSLARDGTALLLHLNDLESQILALKDEPASAERTDKLAMFNAEIAATESELNEQRYASPRQIYSSHAAAEDDLQVISFFLYDWTPSSYRVVAHVRNNANIYAEWVKVSFHYYKSGILTGVVTRTIKYESYENYGMLPYYTCIFDSNIDKITFDRIEAKVEYDVADGHGFFLCDQILQLLEVSVGAGIGYVDWSGRVNNASTWSVERPLVNAVITNHDYVINTHAALLDTKCQGDRTVIIDKVVDAPLEAQKIVLRNCTKDGKNIGGWYLGNKTSPYSYTIPNNTILAAGAEKEFDNDDINFTISTSNEIIYLSNSTKTLVDQWTKDEKDNLLAPLTSACFDALLDVPEFYDTIKFEPYYTISSLSGSGNIAPNRPRFSLAYYALEPESIHNFILFLIDPNGDAVQYQISWGNNELTGWQPAIASGGLASFPHKFNTPGEYLISARARDTHGAVSSWSDSVRVFVDWSVPVELTSFTAHVTNQVVVLNWTTLSESNNLGFQVERSLNKKMWLDIGFVSGHGTSAEEHTFTFVDQSAEKGGFYRLKQIDQDGSFHYSDVISVAVAPASFQITSIYPNPFNATTRIEFHLAEKSMVQIDVFDMSGKRIDTLLHQFLEKGAHSIDWNAGTMASGAYIVRISNSSSTALKKCLLIK